MSKDCFLCNPCTANPSWKQTIGSILCMSLSLTTAILAVSALLGILSFLSVNYGQGSNRHLLEMLETPSDDDETQEHSTPPQKRSSSRPSDFKPVDLIMICAGLELLQEDLVTNRFSFSRFCSVIHKCGGKGFAEGIIILTLLRSGLLAYRRLVTRFSSHNSTNGQTEL